MRKVLAIIVVALGIALASSVLSAETNASSGRITGRAIDAAGRAVVGQRVDLMRGGQVLGASITDTHGSWSFASVAAGEYVVRTNLHGTIAGTRVTVGAGQSVAGTLIVVPTAAVSPQFGALGGLMAGLSTAGASTVTSVATSLAIKTDQTEMNEEAVTAIINALPPKDRVQFAQNVLNAINNNPNSGNVFTGNNNNNNGGSGGNNGPSNNFVDQLHDVVNTGGTATVTITPNAS